MSIGHQGTTISQKRSIERHVVSHVLREQNEESTVNMTVLLVIKMFLVIVPNALAFQVIFRQYDHSPYL